MIVGVVPVETAWRSVRFPIHEEVLDIQSISVLRGARGQAGESEEGRVDVRTEDTVRGLGSGILLSGLADDKRNADPSFIEPSLAGPQGKVTPWSRPTFGAETAIIGKEKDVGVLQDSE